MFSNAHSALTQIVAEWDTAEERIKLAERLCGKVVEPSVNELRYAGRRLIDALTVSLRTDATAEDDAMLQKHIADTVFRCHCAQHDAVDATVLYIQKVIEQYETEFSISAVVRHFPFVTELKAQIAAADDLIVASRNHRGKRPQQYHELATNHLPAMIDLARRITTNRAALEALIAEEEAEKVRRNRQFQLGNVWIPVLTGLGGAVLGGILTAIIGG